MNRLYLKLLSLGIAIFFVGISPVLSQVAKTNEAFENIIEEISNSTDEELDYNTLFDDLYNYYYNPLNLNGVTKEQLEKIKFLNEIQINNILSYQRKNKFHTIYELQYLEGFSRNDIEQLLPFIKVGKVEEKQYFRLKNALKYGRHTLFFRSQFVLEEQKGYKDISEEELAEKPNARYLGNKMKYYTKYKFQYKNKIQAGFVTEKDPGEEFFTGTQKNGFDYYSGHIQLNDFGKFKTVVAGDYQLKFGQGLVLWSGMGGRKSAYVLNTKKTGQGLKKYSSTDENNFMRGIGTTVRLGSFDVTAFVSHKEIDANMNSTSDTLDDQQTLSSFQITGYHRTPGELEDKDVTTETVFGGNLTFRKGNFKAGLTAVNYRFGQELNKSLKPYNQYDFQGKQNTNVGLDYQFTWKDIYFYGEAAISENKGMAFLNGAIFKLVPQVFLSALHRYYEKDYQALHSGGFGEGSKTVNESGLYLGTEIHPYRNWKISAYYDMYHFPWMKFAAYAPTTGVDYFVQVDYSTSSKLNMYWKFKQEKRPENLTTTDIRVKPLSETDKMSFRYHISYSLNRNWGFKSRFEYSKYKQEGKDGQEGYLIYQDVNYRPSNLPLTLSFRYALFDTEGYDARIYAYESDILYAFSVPGYYYKGNRTYLTMKYTIKRGIDLWLRYARTEYTNRETVGSSLNEIDGNTQSEVKIQVRFKF